MSKEPHSRRPPPPMMPELPRVEPEQPAVQPRPARQPINISRHLHPIAIGVCAAFILLFVIVSFTAVRGKSATYDEPLHGLAAWTNLHLHDFRMNFEDPPLWKYWAAIPNSTSSITFNANDPMWVKGVPESVYHGWDVSNRTLYQTPGTDGAAFINRERFMMVLLGGVLGGVISLWSWRLGGPIAAMIAAGLFAFDPNLLGHAGMIKNDVPMSLLLAAVFLACWQVGNKLTLRNAAILCLLVAVAVNTKFSALLLAPMLILAIAIRVCLPLPWLVLGRVRSRLATRGFAGIALLVIIALVSYVGIWASYGFRFNPTPDPAISLNTHLHKVEAIHSRFSATHPRPDIPDFDASIPLKQQIDELKAEAERYRTVYNQAYEGTKNSNLSAASRDDLRATLRTLGEQYQNCERVLQQATNFLSTTPPEAERATNYGQQYAQACQTTYAARASLMDRDFNLRLVLYHEEVGDEAPDSFIGFLNVFLDHHLLPSAWVNGVLFVHARSMYRSSFLMGQTSGTGWWYYFPLATLFKTPVATLLTLLSSVVLGCWLTFVKRKDWQRFIWPLACLVVPFGVYVFSAMTTNLNIGIRHILPIFPLIYVTCGVLLAIAVKRWKRPIIIAVALVGLLLSAETLLGYPNYIGYFNFVFRGNAINLLSDSNLDWGQDLPLLAKWQKEHPDIPLAFGPWAWQEGTPGSYFGTVDPAFYGIKSDPFYLLRPNSPSLKDTHVLAVSATYLQGVYGTTMFKEMFQGKTPLAVLGGTIYLYDLRPKR